MGHGRREYFPLPAGGDSPPNLLLCAWGAAGGLHLARRAWRYGGWCHRAMVSACACPPAQTCCNAIHANLSYVGAGIGPPNVEDAPKPTSSVMMSRTFGAPLGAAIPLGKSGVDSFAARAMRRGWTFRCARQSEEANSRPLRMSVAARHRRHRRSRSG
jgi:hypothetical protein